MNVLAERFPATSLLKCLARLVELPLREFVATFGLVAVSWGVVRTRPQGGWLCSGSVYYGGILVYIVNIICESSGHNSRDNSLSLVKRSEQ